MAKTTTTWNKANFKWNVAPTNTRKSRYTWDEISLVKYAAGIASTATEDDFIHPLFDKDLEIYLEVFLLKPYCYFSFHILFF